MMESAGLLMYRRSREGLEVFLVHPGGPYFVRKDDGYWTIPKGLVEEGEVDLETARREFEEETSIAVPAERAFFDLGKVRQKGGKLVHAWAFEGDCDPSCIRSNTFEIEWPPRSGRMQSFDEVDRASWFGLEEARIKINQAQKDFLDRLEASLPNAVASDTDPPD